ncbi:hypothetical protein N7513_011995 [Penicillium frequentans]|uniref:Uncharacterized protein n=1 Tax=Penicillium frequentans TaxID=3151616 RepID=A0AAD6D339_9EURO|nr:hypothetical protein N7513_011995 [Penicillium glabrum]KAJ5546878.1 hypothetical protein N7494_004463 [Penicillium glabrum]
MSTRLSQGLGSSGSGETSAPEQTEAEKRFALQCMIAALWKEAYLGLFRLRNNQGPLHATRLLELYAGAGMSVRLLLRKGKNTSAIHQDLGLLGVALDQNQLWRLELYEGLPTSWLESVVEMLEAYKREAESLTELYGILRKLQVGFRQPTLEDEDLVLEQYSPAAENLAKRLLHLDAKMKILQSELSDWHWEKHGQRSVKLWRVENEVFSGRMFQGDVRI